MDNLLIELSKSVISNPPIKLFEEGAHSIWWVGINENTAFRSNVYLIKDGDEAVLVDPGHRAFYPSVKNAVSQIMDVKNVKALILCHQDPDVCAAMVDWLDFNPSIKIISTPRTHVLLPYYGKVDYDGFNASDDAEFAVGSTSLKFIECPFMHFPGAFATYDPISGYLLSGDVWAAIDSDWKLVTDDFEAHISGLDIFHKDYIASNVACRGFVEKLQNVRIEAILPQHGSIIAKPDVDAALKYIEELNCGLDIIYPHLGL
jgi:flavorubredoxin